MTKIKFVGLFVLLATTSLYAKDISIVTDKSTIDGNLKVNVLRHPKYDYESIDMYQENKIGESTLLGNYKKGELDNTTIALSTAYKQSVLKGVINNPKIVNEGSEVYIKSNLAYYTTEGNEMEWDYLFSGLGKASNVIWTITSYDENSTQTGLRVYDEETLPSTLTVGTHIIKLEYYDLYGDKFESSKTVIVAKKIVEDAKIILASEIEDKEDIAWNYSFNGIVRESRWYINDELQRELPKRLSEGTYEIKLEIINALGSIYTCKHTVNVKHIQSLDDYISGSLPEGTTISTNASTNEGPLSNLLDTTMYNWWSARGYSAVITLEFPKPIDISMFEIGHGGTPSCEQTITLDAYSSSNEKLGGSKVVKYTIYDNTGISNDIWVKTPYKFYASWEDVEFKNCKKLVLNLNGNKSWASLRMIGLWYTESNT